MLGSWSVSHWPKLQFDVFLSHCAEDRTRIVIPTFDRLQSLRIIPWIDRHHYPRVSDPFDALRDKLILCRHVVYFVTPNLLKQGRGWCATERTLAELIQRHFAYTARTLWRFEIPLFFVDRSDPRLNRSNYAPLIPRARWYADRRITSMSRINWAVTEIQAAFQEQHAEIKAIEGQIASDQALRRFVNSFPGLNGRITSRFPDPVV